MDDQKQSKSPAAGCLVRLFWTLIGHASLLILGIYIFEKHARSLSIFDGLYCLILALIILARFLDVRFLNGETVYGQPASMAHFRKHVMASVPVLLILLILAHVLGRFFS